MLTSWISVAAKAALRRKKQHEHSLEQTTAQIATIEQQIYSIEAANINQETLLAMQKAGQAMKKIHGGLTMDKIDQTMYVFWPVREASCCNIKSDSLVTGTSSGNNTH